jgi:Acyl-CoA thioesterase N-terminal domain/Acyl-CoA thioesterase C-terminal domain
VSGAAGARTSGSVHCVPNAFFEPAGTDGRSFAATQAAAGPWSAQSQHGGPPSAIAARAMELHEPEPGQRLARVAVDILRPVPVGKVTLTTRTLRPGRRVALLETVIEADGQEVLHARGWRIAVPDEPVPAVPDPRAGGTPPPPDALEPRKVQFRGAHTAGYLDAVEWRYVTGNGFEVLGPAVVWARPTIPLIADEELSPMCRALLIADSGSGVSATLDARRFLFINVDLEVVLTRDLEGEWVLLDGATTIGERGTGLAETKISDTRGPCGTATQTLLVAPR